MKSNFYSTVLTLSVVAVGVLDHPRRWRSDKRLQNRSQFRPVAGHYIVVFKDTVNDVSDWKRWHLAQTRGGAGQACVMATNKGFSTFPDAQCQS
jgi:hypothetical protein